METDPLPKPGPAVDGPYRPPEEPFVERGLRVRHIMYAVVWIGLALSALTTAPLVLALFLLFGTILGVLVAVARQLAGQQDALLWVLATSSERRLPLTEGVEAFAGLCGAVYRWRVETLARWLRQGASLPDALLFTPGIVPRSAMLYARVGWGTAALPGALRDAAAGRLLNNPHRRRLMSTVLYLLLVVAVMPGILGFFGYFIAPKFRAIFADFGVTLPPITTGVIDVTERFLFSPLVLLPLAGEMALLAALVVLLLSYSGWVEVELPLVDRLFRRRHSVTLLRALAVVVEGGRPLVEGLHLIARYYPRAWIRRRLARAQAAVVEGLDWREALRRQGLITAADADALEAAGRAGNLTWALRELARNAERRSTYRLQVLVQVLFPIVVVAIGAVVGAFCVAYFSPLVLLIERLA